MAKSVNVRGSITHGSGLCCAGVTTGLSAESIELAGSCGDEGVSYADVVTLAPVIATSGDIGQNFVRLGIELSEIEFLRVKSSARVRLRIDARPSTTLAVGGTYPTLFVGGEVVNWYLDQLPVIVVTFSAGDQSVEQVAARFNAAAALAGAPTPIVTVSNGQLLFTSPTASPSTTASRNAFVVPSPAVSSTLGLTLSTLTPGKGGDVDIQGLAILQFPRSPNAPLRIDASGSATLDIIAAGRPA